jgi:exosortase A-associated hydrolase 1
MRQMISFLCGDDLLAGTLDTGDLPIGIIIVSGGNEIRGGAFAGQATMAAHFAVLGYPVFRFDRRGVGESEGLNTGFENSADDIAAAVAAFRNAAPGIERIVAFGNCDAASALALFHHKLSIDALILANAWVIETPSGDADQSPAPNANAIRARYWARLKNPRSLIDLLTGKIDLRKLAGGLASAARKQPVSGLAARLATALARSVIPTTVLVAQRDTTAMAFMGAWQSEIFADVRARPDVRLAQFDSASHGFADAASRHWLFEQIQSQCEAPFNPLP